MAEETIYLCNFRVSVDGDWLCLRELSDVQLEMSTSLVSSLVSPEDGLYCHGISVTGILISGFNTILMKLPNLDLKRLFSIQLT